MDALESTKIKIAKQLPLSVSESLQHLIHGNGGVARGIRLKKEVAPKEYDVVAIACSDARCEVTGIGDYTSQKMLMLQFAGNVFSEDLDPMLLKLRDKGEIINCGHISCGACDAKSHESQYKGISTSIDRLLMHVEIAKKTSYAKDIYSGNAINQAEKLKHNSAVTRKRATVTPLLFDFTSGSEPLRFLRDGDSSATTARLRANALRTLSKTKNERKSLATQYAHAVVVSEPLDLETVTNSRILFGAGLNELFCVSACGMSNAKLSANAIASIEYALLKVNGIKDTAHIVVLHSSDSSITKIRDELLESRIIREKTKNGETITLMKYDKATGAVK